MVLEQDKPQASQAQAVLDEQQYQKDLAQYNQDLEKYNKEKEEYDKQQKKIADAKAAEEARIAEEKRKEKEKADKRAAQYKAIEEKYAKQYADSLHAYQNAPNPTPHQIYSGYKAGYVNKKNYDTRNKEINKQHQAELTELRTEHYTADGFPFVNVGTVTRDAGQLLGDIAMGRGMGYRNISAQGRHQVELIMAKRNLLSGNITESQYFEQTGQSKSKKQAYDKQQDEMRSAQARAQVAGYLAADAKHWQSVQVEIMMPNIPLKVHQHCTQLKKLMILQY